MTEFEEMLKAIEGLDMCNLLSCNPYSYPNEWFKKNPGKKPTINVCYTQNKPGLRESLVRSLYAEICLKQIKKEHAITFLYIYAKDSMKETLNADWKSYSLTIGLHGSTITPLNIIDVDIKEFDFESLKETNVQLPSSDDWLAFYLCTIYRLNNTQSNEYRKTVADLAMKEILKISRHNAIRTLNFHELALRLNNVDYDYNGLIAAYDMFLHKFPNNSAKFCRFGTRDSRLRDCTALSSYFNVRKCLGMNLTDLIEWTILTRFDMAYKRLLTEEEEYLNEYSYFMYQMDFHLVGRSAYSATVNSCAHFFFNLIAGLCLLERGLRAKILHDIKSKNWTRLIVKNAILVAYVFRQRTFGEKPYVLEPKSINNGEWIRFMQSRDGKLTDSMFDWFKNRRAKMIRTNAGTVGDLLQNIDRNFLDADGFN